MKFELDRDQIACIRHALIVDRDAADVRANAAVTDDPSPKALAEAYRYAVLCTSTLQALDGQAAEQGAETAARRAERARYQSGYAPGEPVDDVGVRPGVQVLPSARVAAAAAAFVPAEAHRAARETRRADMRLCGAVGDEPCRWAGTYCGPCSEAERRPSPPKPKRTSPWDDLTEALHGAGVRVRQYKIMPLAFRQALAELVADVARADRAEREADVPDEDALDTDPD